MEDIQPQELEDLVHELGGENGAEESLPPDVEEFLRRLESDRLPIDQRDAAVRLGRVGSSSPRIVRALCAACESPSYSLSIAAAEALRSPVHQEYLQQHPDLMEEVGRALPAPAGTESDMPTVGPEAERILVQIEGETGRHEWRTASLALDPVAGAIKISGYRAGVPRISIPVSEISGCEIVVKEGGRDQDPVVSGGGDLASAIFLGFIVLIGYAVGKAGQVPAIKVTQSVGDGERRQRVIHLRSTETGDRGQAATAEIARRMAAFLRRSGYSGVIPDELSEPASFESLLRAKRRGGLLRAVIALSAFAGLVVGLLIGIGQGGQAQSPAISLACGAGFLIALAVGAVVGAVVGAAVTWRNDRIAGIVAGAIAAAVAAPLSWLPTTVWRIIETGGSWFRW